MRRTLILGGCVAAVVGIGALDHATGVELRLFALYMVPLAVAASSGRRRAAAVLATVNTAVWCLANVPHAAERWSALVLVVNATTQAIAFFTIGLLIAELRRRLDHEQELGRVDDLTKLPNSRAFYERAELVLAGSRRSRRPCTIAYADLDNFKRVNDERGHQAGDAALRAAADVLRSHTRACDVIARMGGDEFAVFMPDCGEEDARAAFERVRRAVLATMSARGWPITMSVGAVCFSEPPASLDQAIGAADALMYEAKQRGKNVLCVAPAEGEARPERRASDGGGERALDRLDRLGAGERDRGAAGG